MQNFGEIGQAVPKIWPLEVDISWREERDAVGGVVDEPLEMMRRRTTMLRC